MLDSMRLLLPSLKWMIRKSLHAPLAATDPVASACSRPGSPPRSPSPACPSNPDCSPLATRSALDRSVLDQCSLRAPVSLRLIPPTVSSHRTLPVSPTLPPPEDPLHPIRAPSASSSLLRLESSVLATPPPSPRNPSGRPDSFPPCWDLGCSPARSERCPCSAAPSAPRRSLRRRTGE